MVWVFLFYRIARAWLWVPFTHLGVDFSKHWYAACALLDGRSVYQGESLWMGFNYPQAVAFSFVWLKWFNCPAAEMVWKGMMLGLLFLCWGLAWRWLAPRAEMGTGQDETSAVDYLRKAQYLVAGHWPWVCLFGLVCYQPVNVALYAGNVDVLSAWLAMVMAVLLVTRCERSAGAVWALLALVKILPVMLVLVFVLWRRWRVLAGFAAVMAVYALLLLLTGRVGDEWFLLRNILPEAAVYWRGISMTPMRFVLYEIGLRHWYDSADIFRVLAFIHSAIVGGSMFVLLMMLRRRRGALLQAVECAIVSYTLLTPLLEYVHFSWMLPVFFLQLRRWAGGAMRPMIASGLALGWFGLFSSFFFIFHLSKLGPWVTMAPTLGGFAVVTVFTWWDALAPCADRGPGERMKKNALEVQTANL